MNKGREFSDAELLNMLADAALRAQAIGYLYGEVKQSVIRMVVKYDGTETDALEMINEGMLVLVRNVKRGDFESRSKLRVYLIGICKLLWRNRLKVRAKEQKQVEITEQEAGFSASVMDHLERAENAALVRRCLANLKEVCQNIFQWRYYLSEPLPWDMVAEKLGYDNAQVARNRGQRCMKALKNEFQKWAAL
ncbi:MAG: sigma-70 family RNA polymerase sigma factor [Bacteroidota bacterium]